MNNNTLRASALRHFVAFENIQLELYALWPYVITAGLVKRLNDYIRRELYFHWLSHLHLHHR